MIIYNRYWFGKFNDKFIEKWPIKSAGMLASSNFCFVYLAFCIFNFAISFTPFLPRALIAAELATAFNAWFEVMFDDAFSRLIC